MNLIQRGAEINQCVLVSDQLQIRAVGSYLSLVQPEQPRGVWGHVPPGKYKFACSVSGAI